MAWASETFPERDRRTLALFGSHDVNATRYLGQFLAVTFGALRVRFFVLSDGFLEGFAAFFTAILVGRHVSLPHFRSNGSNEIPLPQFNDRRPKPTPRLAPSSPSRYSVALNNQRAVSAAGCASILI